MHTKNVPTETEARAAIAHTQGYNDGYFGAKFDASPYVGDARTFYRLGYKLGKAHANPS